MTNSGNVHISDTAKVFGPVAGHVAGDVNTAYNFNYDDVQPKAVEPEMSVQAQA